jgi:hypothetical protein
VLALAMIRRMQAEKRVAQRLVAIESTVTEMPFVDGGSAPAPMAGTEGPAAAPPTPVTDDRHSESTAQGGSGVPPDG